MTSNPIQSISHISTIIRNIGQLVTIAQKPIAGTYGALQIASNAAIAAYDGKIVWIGSNADADHFIHDGTIHGNTMIVIDAEGAVVTPGMVDSHTHLLFAGDRAEEFHLKRQGVSYGELLAQGYGIATTMKATRAASQQTLLGLAHERLETMKLYGTTTVEGKTGYGLDFATEERCLSIMHDLNTHKPASTTLQNHIRVVPTFLGAHSLPPEYKGRREAYIDLICEQMLPAFVPLARFCDVFCEREAFTLDECRHILRRAKDLGYLLKVHADQLSSSGGARLAAEMGAVSADHLDFASDTDLDAMREAGVVATLLPGCSYTLRTPYPSARRLLDRGLHVALATDYNPGTSYTENMQTILGLAMSAMSMTLEEALAAVTIEGARALALQAEIGSVEVGKRCELAVWTIRDYREIGYHFGTNLVRSVICLDSLVSIVST